MASSFLPLKSMPPEANPIEIFDTGIITVPDGVLMGLPMTVLASIIERMFSSED